MNKNWRGIFAIVVTPFTEDLELDEAALRRQIEFCIGAGAAGLVGPANAGEFAVMSDEERQRWIRIVVEEADGRVPVVAATTHGHRLPAAALSLYAQDVGADGVMAMPPHILHPDADGCYNYFRALNDTLHIPICIQNFMGPIGTPMSSELLARMCRELEWVQYLKEETLPEPRAISRTLAAAGDACQGVFGGQGGIYMIDEWRRGACGNMPASQSVDLHTKIWQLLEANDETSARALFNRLLPLLNFERMHGVAVYKQVFVRRGIFTSAASRIPGAYLDQHDLQEFDAIWCDIEQLFTT
jgi:dihydrodipicolinate synthase/N-acetylneuraminate lyase